MKILTVFILMLASVYICLPGSVLAAGRFSHPATAALEKCIEQAKKEFESCLEKAKSPGDKQACEKTFDKQYSSCSEPTKSK